MLPLSSSSLSSRPLTEDCRQRFGKVAVAVHVFVDWLEFLTDAAQNFLIGKKPLQQLLPVRNRAVFQHQLQRDVLEKQVFGRLNHPSQTHSSRLWSRKLLRNRKAQPMAGLSTFNSGKGLLQALQLRLRNRLCFALRILFHDLLVNPLGLGRLLR
jgi:hypothetical protein